ncbi:putative AC transposase [Glycine soja]
MGRGGLPVSLLNPWFENLINYNILRISLNPDLSLLACDILSIQITTMTSKSAFSIGSRVLNKYQTRLLGDNMQALICTKNWLLGFDEQGKEYEDVEMKKAQATSNMKSFVVGDV